MSNGLASVRPSKPTMTVTQTYEASKNQLKTRREHKAGDNPGDDEIQEYWYTNLGDLACVTNDDVTGSTFDCNNPGAHADDRLQLYTWDALERLTAARTLNTSGDIVVRSTTDYDGLDRPVVSRECHTQPDCQASQWWQEGRQTNLAYLGASPQVAKETITGDTHQSDFKTYSYDPAGGRIGIETDNGSSTANYTYAYDAHGSVTLLVDGSGDAQASYGYDSYGGEDDKLTKELKQGSSTLITPATDPLNAYRYTAKREDTGSGTLDMGARRFAPDTGRFLSTDFYAGALSDLSLSSDPLTANRYALAGGNPVSYVEVDGHRALDANGDTSKTAVMNTYKAQQDAADAPSGSSTSSPHDSSGPVSGTTPDAPIYPTVEAYHFDRLTPEERHAKEASLRISHAQHYAELAEHGRNEKTARMFRNYFEGNVCGGGGHETACFVLANVLALGAPGVKPAQVAVKLGPTGTRLVTAVLAVGSKQAARQQARAVAERGNSIYWAGTTRAPITTMRLREGLDTYHDYSDEIDVIAEGMWRIFRNSL